MIVDQSVIDIRHFLMLTAASLASAGTGVAVQEPTTPRGAMSRAELQMMCHNLEACLQRKEDEIQRNNQ